jgi:hypothetical protein
VWDAYLRTTFVAETPNGKIEIRPGSSSVALDSILRKNRVAEWAYVTAYNPGSRLMSDEINKRAHEELRRVVSERRLICFDEHGVGPGGVWPPEASLLVLGLSMDQARALGRQFGQLAIVVGRARELARLRRGGGASSSHHALSADSNIRTIVGARMYIFTFRTCGHRSLESARMSRVANPRGPIVN